MIILCAEGIFEGVNMETDKREKEKKFSHRKISNSAYSKFNLVAFVAIDFALV